MIKSGLLIQFIKRRLILEDGLLLNPEMIAEEVFFLLRSRLTDRSIKPNRSFFCEHTESLLRSYGERLRNIENEAMLFHEVTTLFSQACEGGFHDLGGSSFSGRANEVDQDVNNEADFMLVMGSTD